MRTYRLRFRLEGALIGDGASAFGRSALGTLVCLVRVGVVALNILLCDAVAKIESSPGLRGANRLRRDQRQRTESCPLNVGVST